ncbi:MAG: glycosyltransferase family 4 protein [Candidatus Paceibacteria bacterium]
MKILFTITKSTIGGAQTHISQLTSSLLEDGHKVGVISQPGGWLEEDIKEKGAQFFPNKYLRNSYNPITLLNAIETTQEAINNFSPDLFSTHSSFAGFVGRLAAKKYDFPTVFTAHGWGFSTGTPVLQKIIVKNAEKLAAKYTDKIICVSNYDKKLAKENNIANPSKLTTIHNGTEIPEIEYDQFPIQPDEKIKIVFVGRLSTQKAPLLLVKALDHLPQDLKQKVDLTLIGGGEKSTQIKNYLSGSDLSGQVELTGDISRDQVFEYLKQSHIFTLITNWEGFPRSILEAMSCGLPVIATNVAGIPESVTSQCGILVEKDNLKDVTNAFKKMLSNPEEIEKKGKNARERCKNKFSIKNTIEGTKEVYRELLS